MPPHRATAVALLCGLLLSAPPSMARAQAPEWHVREELRLGGGQAPTRSIPRILRATVGRDGTLYALSDGGELLIVGRAGDLTRRVRLHADGTAEVEPEEQPPSRSPRERRPDSAPATARGPAFAQSAAMGWFGDTLWVLAGSMRHVALLGPKGDVIRRIPFSRNVAEERANLPLALLADGSLLRTITQSIDPGDEGLPPPGPPEGYQMPIIPFRLPGVDDAQRVERHFLVRATPGGRVLQGLETFTDGQTRVTVRSPLGDMRAIPLPFRDHPLVAVPPDGSEVVFVERYAAARAERATYSVVRFDARTGKRSARPYPYVPAPITRATRDSIASRLIDSGDSPIDRRFLNGFLSPGDARTAILRAIDVGEFHAPITEVVAAADGSVWLREQASGRWVVLGRDGAMLGAIALPSGVRLLHADAGAAWGFIEGPAERPASGQLIRYRLPERHPAPAVRAP